MHANDIKSFMSIESRLDGSFDAWINAVAGSPSWAITISKELLINGRDICCSSDEDAFRCLVDSVKQAAGVGKGIFHSSLIEMSESFSRTQLKMWVLEEALTNIKQSSWHTVLKSALQTKKIELGIDLIHQMERRFGKISVVQVLSELDDASLSNIKMIWEPYRDLLVSELCCRSSFNSAIHYAGHDKSLEKTVMNSIGLHIGFNKTPGDWPDLMRFMIQKSKNGDNSQSVMDYFKSAGSVVVNKILEMSPGDIEAKLRTDELRLMAFKWGLDKAVEHIDSLESKSQALEFTLGI